MFLVFFVLILLFCVLVGVDACIYMCTSTYKSTVLVWLFPENVCSFEHGLPSHLSSFGYELKCYGV
jgi:hypothetical protein